MPQPSSHPLPSSRVAANLLTSTGPNMVFTKGAATYSLPLSASGLTAASAAGADTNPTLVTSVTDVSAEVSIKRRQLRASERRIELLKRLAEQPAADALKAIVEKTVQSADGENDFDAFGLAADTVWAVAFEAIGVDMAEVKEKGMEKWRVEGE